MALVKTISTIPSLVAGIVFLGGAATAWADSPDSAFMKKAAAGGMAEVEMGKLAQQKASSPQVKQFGAQMVTDHSKANDELKQVAAAKGVQLPAGPAPKHKQAMEKMQKMSGAAFDRAYVADMLKDHKEDVSDFEKEASAGKDADVKAFAARTLPTLKEHLTMVQSLSDSTKAAGK